MIEVYKNDAGPRMGLKNLHLRSKSWGLPYQGCTASSWAVRQN